MYSYLLFFHFSRGKFSLSPGYRNFKSCGNLMNQKYQKYQFGFDLAGLC